MTKPDFMVLVPDLYRRQRRHQGRRRLARHPPEPQGHFLGVYLIMYYDSTQLTKYTNLLHTLSTNTFREILPSKPEQTHPSGGPRRAELA